MGRYSSLCSGSDTLGTLVFEVLRELAVLLGASIEHRELHSGKIELQCI